MKPPTKKPQHERSATDESLRFERSKTDEELAAARASLEEDADAVVELARQRAAALLEKTRERSDQDLTEQAASDSLLREVAKERGVEDRVQAQERSIADDELDNERRERERALASLLRHEREQTDDKLTVERSRADHAVSTRDDFLGMVSHDLRSMLGGIAMGAAMLASHAEAQGEAGAETLRQTDRIQRFTARMNRLIGDLLDVVSIEAGKLAVSPRPLDASLVVRDAMEAYQISFAAKGITLSSHVADGTLLAKFDHERVLQVLANLLSNALKFSPQGSQVLLSATPVESQVRFSVVDTGVGIPTEQLSGIFERFHQVEAGDRRGVGLGLYIARCIVEAHGGAIWAERPESGGTAVHFTLPGVA